MLKTITEEYECVISEGVYDEAIRRGKEEAYEEALRIEEIAKKSIKCKKVKSNPKAEQILKAVISLGKGEKESLHLFLNEGADAIVSDDRTFLNLLQRNEVKFLTPANVVVELGKRGKITKGEGMEALDKMKPLIRGEVYKKAKEDLESLGGGA